MVENLAEEEGSVGNIKPTDVDLNSLGSIIQDFARSLDALREFVDLIEPILKKRVKEVSKEHRTGLLPLMVALNRLELRKEAQAEPSREEFLENKLKELFGENITVDVKGTGAGGTIDIKVSGTAVSKVQQAMKAFSKAIRHPTLLHRSSLISLVSIGEWFLSQILHNYFDKYPGAIGATEKFFSLEQLKSFNSIDDAKVCLIDSKVEEIMRGSFEDYIKFLREKIKLSLGYLDKDCPQLIEIYQRRNILVHNGGRVNTTYLTKVNSELSKDLSVSDEIPISHAYLDKAIGLYDLNFVLIAAEFWKHLDSSDKSRAIVLGGLAFDHLCDERWDIAEGLSYFIMNDKQMPEVLRLKSQINYWQSIKWQGRYDEIRSNVEKVDFSAKDPLFQLALLSLLDKDNEFFDLLPKVIRSGGLEFNDLTTWPLFREMRKKPAWSAFLVEHKEEIEMNQTKLLDGPDGSSQFLPAENE